MCLFKLHSRELIKWIDYRLKLSYLLDSLATVFGSSNARDSSNKLRDTLRKNTKLTSEIRLRMTTEESDPFPMGDTGSYRTLPLPVLPSDNDKLFYSINSASFVGVCGLVYFGFFFWSRLVSLWLWVGYVISIHWVFSLCSFL